MVACIGDITLKETEFPPDERAFVPCRAFPEQSSTGLGRGETGKGDKAIGGEALPP